MLLLIITRYEIKTAGLKLDFGYLFCFFIGFKIDFLDFKSGNSSHYAAREPAHRSVIKLYYVIISFTLDGNPVLGSGKLVHQGVKTFICL